MFCNNEKAQIIKYCELIPGSPQFRLHAEPENPNAPVYTFYGSDIQMADLADTVFNKAENVSKQISTFDPVITLQKDDIVFNLVNQQCAKVGEAGNGCLITQNFVKLVPAEILDAGYLVYLLNEDPLIRKQIDTGTIGSAVQKMTLQNLRQLELSPLPSLEEQKAVGQAYLVTKKLCHMRIESAKQHEKAVIEMLRRKGRTYGL